MSRSLGWWQCWYSIILILSRCISPAWSREDDVQSQKTRRGSPISDDGHYFQYVTRQDIQAPTWNILRNNKTLLAPGYWFIAPYEEKTQEVPGGKFIGPHIYDGDGELIWSGTPFFGHWNVFDFTVANVSGQPHLAMQDWHGQRGVILDSSYEIWKTAPMLAAGDTFQNMHAFHVVDDGKKALPLNVRHWDAPAENSIRDVGYNGTCKVGYQGFRELDLTKPGTPIVFEWEPKEHVSLNESTYIKYNGKDYDGTAKDMCIRGWDAMHVNSVDKFPDGDYLVSARHSDTLYKISHVDESIVWRLGGKTSDFEFGDNAKFARQHHGEVLKQNSSHITISLFDNAVGEGWQMAERRFSRGLIMSLDLNKMTANVTTQFGHPQGRLSSGRGSMQVLPNGNAFINWADDSHISEHLPNGTVLGFQASLPAKIDTYRAFKFPWIGRPKQPPDVHAEVTWDDDHNMTTKISMSWNGATEVEKWAVHGVNAEGKAVHIDTVPRDGFETTLDHDGLVTNVYAEALDKHGTILGTSKDGGMAWPGRIPGLSKAKVQQDEESTSSESSGVVTAVILTVIIIALAAGGFYLYGRFRRKTEVQESEDKGAYRQVGQEEEGSDD